MTEVGRGKGGRKEGERRERGSISSLQISNIYSHVMCSAITMQCKLVT